MTTTSNPTPLSPALDIYEQGHKVFVLAEMPGVNHDNLNIQVNGKTLNIKGVIALPTADGEQQGHEEVTSPYYSRTLQLSDDLDSTNIEANYNDGILTLQMSKKVKSEPRKIQVEFS